MGSWLILSCVQKCIENPLVNPRNADPNRLLSMQGTIRGSKFALRHMGKNGRPTETTGKGGIILNISSIQALLSWPAMPTYSAGKSGIIAYTRCAGHEVEFAQHGVKMMSLCPFGVVTPMQDFEVYTGMSQVGEDFLSQQDVKDRILSSDEVGENYGINLPQSNIKVISELPQSYCQVNVKLLNFLNPEGTTKLP